MKKFKNTTIMGYNGKPLMSRDRDESGQVKEEKEIKLVNALWVILNAAPLKSQNDSIQGSRLAKSLDKAEENGFIEIEDGVHDWLKPIAEQVTPQLFRINGHVIYELIKEGFEKVKETKDV